jgi:hypothetical protein
MGTRNELVPNETGLDQVEFMTQLGVMSGAPAEQAAS